MERVYWCSLCDAKQVDRDKPETGRFYVVFGHEWSGKADWSGDYHSIGFALCPDCSLTDYLKPHESDPASNNGLDISTT